MELLLELISLQTENLSLADQMLLAVALLAPYCGILIGLVFWLNTNRASKWLISWIAPAVWLASVTILISQLPGKDFLLLISSIGLAYPVTALYYSLLTIFSLAHLKDAVINIIFHKPKTIQKTQPVITQPHAIEQPPQHEQPSYSTPFLTFSKPLNTSAHPLPKN